MRPALARLACLTRNDDDQVSSIAGTRIVAYSALEVTRFDRRSHARYDWRPSAACLGCGRPPELGREQRGDAGAAAAAASRASRPGAGAPVEHVVEGAGHLVARGVHASALRYGSPATSGRTELRIAGHEREHGAGVGAVPPGEVFVPRARLERG